MFDDLAADLNAVPEKKNKMAEAPVLQWIHPFEVKGMGKSPYTFVRLEAGSAKCDYCGTSIRNIYHVVSSDKKYSIVGSECIKKTEDQHLVSVVRMHERNRRADAKARKVKAAKEVFIEDHPEIASWLDAETLKGNSFALSLWSSLNKYGSLTDGQIRAVHKNLTTEEEKHENWVKFQQEHPDAAELLETGTGDFMESLRDQVRKGRTLSDRQMGVLVSHMKNKEVREQTDQMRFNRVVEMFKTAKQKLKKPGIRMQGIFLSAAPDTGKNPGCIYLKCGEQYLGKILPDASLVVSKAFTDEHMDTLRKLEEDPLRQAVEYGRETGSCACCGRVLHNNESIELGIGPICAGKWGLK